MTAPVAGAPPKAAIAWSSGKDSAWALHEVRRSRAYDVAAALVVVRADDGRVPMHHVRDDLLAAQLEAAGLPCIRAVIPTPCPDEVYARVMSDALTKLKRAGIEHVIFGDLFLEEVRAGREDRLRGTGITPVFPLWGRPTRALVEEMLAGGVETWLTSVDGAKLPPAFVGRKLDMDLLAQWPGGADPCGENGEFHSFVAAGPMLARRVAVEIGQIMQRDGFACADLRLRRAR